MMKITTANVPTNNIYCKKAISGLFTAVTLLTVLIGNSSFISEGIGQTLEKTSIAIIKMLPIGEEITAVKISAPSRSMIRKADREIHLNMNEMIKELNSFQLVMSENKTTDQEMNNQFYDEYRLSADWEKFDNADVSLAAQFDAENINMNLNKSLLTSDNLIFRQFYLSDYSIPNPVLITDADVRITEAFYTENN